MMLEGATSQLDLPSLTPFSVAGCGRLQLGVPYWATLVYYCKSLKIGPTFCGSRFSTGRLLAIEEFTFFLLISSKLGSENSNLFGTDHEREGVLSFSTELV